MTTFTLTLTEDQYNVLGMALARAFITTEDRSVNEDYYPASRATYLQEAEQINALRDHMYANIVRS